jgi:hypothetical protein
MRNTLKTISLCILGFSLAPISIIAMGPPSSNGFSLTASAYSLMDSSLDSGADWSMNSFRLKVDRQWNPDENNRVTLGLAYEYQDHGFTDGQQLWESVQVPEISLSWMRRLNQDWSLLLAPSLQVPMEKGADTGDALRFGGFFAFNRNYSRNLQIGFGAGIFTGLEDSKVFPLLMVRWQIDEQWYLGNPFAPGPMGPAGLEIGYQQSKSWSLAMGSVYRSNRFALDDKGMYADGFGEVEGVALFIRSSHDLEEAGELHIYAGTLLAGELILDDERGTTQASTDFDPSLLIAIAWQGRF